MKTLFFKKTMMPLAVIVCGVAGAFATMSMKGSDTLVDQVGYRYIGGECLSTSVMCTPEAGDICKSGTITLWGKVDELENECPVQLFHLPQ